MDFDNDGRLGRDDLRTVVHALVGEGEMEEEEVDNVVSRLIQEGDLDGQKALSFDEYYKLISRLQDFDVKFRLPI